MDRNTRVIVPPIRNALQDQTAASGTATAINPAAVAGQTPITDKSWYLFWQSLAGGLNANTDTLGRLIGYGAHADRPNSADSPEGAVYIESDRGSIYQCQRVNGTLIWQYIAGSMWGTVTPDQRPTDLGVHDGGFDFRGTDDAREFIWSQTAWIEATAVWFGTHAARPATGATADGVLYVETDRGNVIYQLETGAWKYCAGVMLGTFSPDQRPTDLGTNDTGFQFRATDQKRTFYWSGSAWVETTPVGPPTTQTAAARAFGTVYQNTTGKPVYVTVSVLAYVSGGNGRVDAYTDASATPSTVVATFFNSIAGGVQMGVPLSFIVLPNNYYRVVLTSGAGGIFQWLEWS